MNAFDRYAPFIRQYIYAQGWGALNELQQGAAQAILDTPDHVLLATPTASGKTEAAFFPMLTDLCERPAESIGILYIGPLKALINDQFERLEGMLRDADIPLFHWHGDVSASHKARALRRARGVLQITPESLEALLMRDAVDLPALFGDLRYVVIDEVHAFLSQERGLQVQCLLARLARLCGCAPRRIGLSATLGDYDAAARYLRGGAPGRVQVLEGSMSGRKLRLSVQSFLLPDDADDDPANEAALRDYWAFLYDRTRGRKSIVFTNSRAEAERCAAHLRDIARERHEPDVFYAHHGSLSAMVRREAEDALRADGPAVAIATHTLELGIDIGDLQRVVQIGAPFTASSFVQRMGRAGRRTGEAEMLFCCPESVPLPQSPVEALPWELLRAISIVELYLEERWIESPDERPLPLSLCYHQTLCALRQMGAMTPPQLARAVLTLPPFAQVPQAMYRELLLHWIDIGHIESMEDGTLIVGMEAERAVNHYSFLAVFPDEETYAVWAEAGEVGTLSTPPQPGETFLLSGRTWRVLYVDEAHKRVSVEEAQGDPSAVWAGKLADIDGRVVAKMRDVLASDVAYAYLQPSAMRRLRDARESARRWGLLSRVVVPTGGDMCYVMPFAGSRAMETLYRLLLHGWRKRLGVAAAFGRRPYWLAVRVAKGKLLETALRSWALPQEADAYLGGREAPIEGKYDEFLPAGPLREAFVRNRLAIGELERVLGRG